MNDDDDEALFDVAIASLVFDVVATDKEDFAKFLANVANIVEPGDDSIKITSTCTIFDHVQKVLYLNTPDVVLFSNKVLKAASLSNHYP